MHELHVNHEQAHEGEADLEDHVVKPKNNKRRHRRKCNSYMPSSDIVASVVDSSPGVDHADMFQRDALKQIILEESEKKIVKAQDVRSSTGATLERWELAAEAEHTNNFKGMGAYHESTPEELAAHGRPLPMLIVWSYDQSTDTHKCRACVCGNFADVDPTQQSWTAQAEPSSLLATIKLWAKPQKPTILAVGSDFNEIKGFCLFALKSWCPRLEPQVFDFSR